jgi:hypothetical protein
MTRPTDHPVPPSRLISRTLAALTRDRLRDHLTTSIRMDELAR